MYKYIITILLLLSCRDITEMKYTAYYDGCYNNQLYLFKVITRIESRFSHKLAFSRYCSKSAQEYLIEVE